MGSLYMWIHGKIEFRDTENEIYAWYNIGSVKRKSQEYFEGEIVAKGKVTDKISGNYCGYIDFNKKRWFDVREVDLVFHKFNDEDMEKTLPSDCVKRTDSRKLSQSLLDEAQAQKEEIEKLQRKDRAGREAASKRRAAGGAKIVYFKK